MRLDIIDQWNDKRRQHIHVQSTILNEIKPADCDVVWLDAPEGLAQYSCYEPRFKTVFIIKNEDIYTPLDREACNNFLLLHEICHHITWDDNALPMAEYKAEKMARNICREYGWNDLLAESTRRLIDMLADPKSKEYEHLDFYGWRYATKRILEEEVFSESMF